MKINVRCELQMRMTKLNAITSWMPMRNVFFFRVCSTPDVRVEFDNLPRLQLCVFLFAGRYYGHGQCTKCLTLIESHQISLFKKMTQTLKMFSFFFVLFGFT